MYLLVQSCLLGCTAGMEAVRTSETSVYNHFTRQYNPEDSSEHHTRRRENLKSHMYLLFRKCDELNNTLADSIKS
jgi:hypothetical protein